MKVAVTGGNGVLGRALAPHLLEQGHTVLNIDRAPPAGPPTSASLSTSFMVADTTDFGALVACLRGCDAVVHLAAHRSPFNAPDTAVYGDNTVGSYNVLSAAATLGIKRVCMASSINAVGAAFSRQPRYDYFPLDEQHPTYAEDPYSLSKWVLEQQGDAFARRFEWMSIASLRFHWILEGYEQAATMSQAMAAMAARHLWAYTSLADSARACGLAITAPFAGHEVFYIVAPRTVSQESSLDLARQHYPDTPVRGELPGNSAFYSCAKAERLLGWRHLE